MTGPTKEDWGEWGSDWFRQQLRADPPAHPRVRGWHVHAKGETTRFEKQLWGDGRWHHVYVREAISHKNWVRLSPNPGFNMFGWHWCKRHHRHLRKGVFS